jgi:hypothetical protein
MAASQMKYSSSIPNLNEDIWLTLGRALLWRSKSIGLQPRFEDGDLPQLRVTFRGQGVLRVGKEPVDIRMVEEAPLSGATIA